MIDIVSIVKQIEAEIKKHHLSKHPFYQLWNEGKVTKHALQEYAIEYYPFMDMVPRLVSRVHSNTLDQQDRFMILENLNEEEDPKELHADLWVHFAQGLGVKKSALGSPKLKETKECLKTLQALCDKSSVEGAAALLAYEGQIPEIAQLKMDGLKKHYNMKDKKSLRFFAVHSVSDIEHQKTWKKMIAKNVKSKADEKRVMTSLRKSLRAINGLLDGVYKHYC